jgi:hypothetical protein
LIRRILALKLLVILILALRTISVRVVALLALAGAANLVKQARTALTTGQRVDHSREQQ